jgi:hypothetical protein
VPLGFTSVASVAKLVDAPALGAGRATYPGSSPGARIVVAHNELRTALRALPVAAHPFQYCNRVVVAFLAFALLHVFYERCKVSAFDVVGELAPDVMRAVVNDTAHTERCSYGAAISPLASTAFLY